MTNFLLRLAGLLTLALAAPAGAQNSPSQADPFLATVKQGVDAWNALAPQAAAKNLPPLREVEEGWFNQDPRLREVAAPDGLRVAGTREGNLYIRSRSSDELSIVKTRVGAQRWTVEDAEWSPDGRHLAVKSIDQSGLPEITLTGPQFGRSGRTQVPYSRIGEPLPTVRLWIVDITTRNAVLVAQRRSWPYINVVGWRGDGKVLRVMTADRILRSLELRAVDAATGSTTLLHSEPEPVSVTSLNMLHGFSQKLRELNLVRFLPDDSFIWTSDRSGFKHLYLHDASGRLVRSLSERRMTGFIDQLLHVDAPGRIIFARATGFDPADPYRQKLVRIDLDRGIVTDLIEAGHIPAARFLPDRKRIQLIKTEFPDVVDIVEITTDGRDEKTLFKTDWTDVLAAGYVPPEVVFVPAADGRTRLRAVVEFPIGFNSAKRYPVIHSIYAGQPTINTPLSPRNEGPWRNAHFGDGSFIFVVIDGRGTPGRGRAFQNFDYHRFGQVQTADQVAALRALAATRPYMDLSRVGVMGGSWGGYFGLRAALEEPELYKAGVFFAGAFEMQRMRVSAEPFMGCSIEECSDAYRKSSNIALVRRLKAPLFLLHGTADNDVPIGETINLRIALERHHKQYEFISIEGWNHFVSRWPDFDERASAFFRRHLGGPKQSIPDVRNGSKADTSTEGTPALSAIP